MKFGHSHSRVTKRTYSLHQIGAGEVLGAGMCEVGKSRGGIRATHWVSKHSSFDTVK
jgi:hypothetical protein